MKFYLSNNLTKLYMLYLYKGIKINFKMSSSHSLAEHT